MPGLGTAFGFGACTNFPRDMRNSDCVLIMGSNMAESHPVGYQWVDEARRRGAVIMHVDPRFTRTSASADVSVLIRPGTDLAFLGAIIRRIIERKAYFTDYIVPYTNAPTLVSEAYSYDQETGLFSGFDPETGRYDLAPASWDYELDAEGRPVLDPTLRHPRCVLRVLEAHYARYTPERVASVCGCQATEIERVADELIAHSGREHTSSVAYALGWTQHTTGPQIIRAAGIIQLLLGNIGRPGGGIIALRGHSNVQGATDIPTLFNSLPNYLPQPVADADHATLERMLKYGHGLEARRGKATSGLWEKERTMGSWASMPAAMISLLKAWYGEAATAANEYGYQNLPKLSGDESEQSYFVQMLHREMCGLFLFGENPAVSSPNATVHRKALRRLRWLVVADAFETESASAWYADPDGPPPESVPTEVFFLPAALGLEKDGSVTNTERLVQWHDQVLPPPGDCRSDLSYVYRIGKRIKELYADSRLERDLPIRQLTWDYAAAGDADEPDAERVLREINGFNTVTGEHLSGASELRDDGTTACGGRLYCGVFPGPGRNLSRRQGGVADEATFFHKWAWAWPGNTRVLYNRASADPEGRPWSERKKLLRWDEAAGRWAGPDVPHFEVGKPPSYRPAPGSLGLAAIAGTEPFTIHFDGRGWLYAPFGLADGPLPVYYEPLESPVMNGIIRQQMSPLTLVIRDTLNHISAEADPDYPLVLTTYRFTEHFLAGGMTRNDAWLAELQPSLFFEISPQLAELLGLEMLEWAVVETPRGAIEGRVLVTPRLRPLFVRGRSVHIVGIPMHFGYRGEIVGDTANLLSPISLGIGSDIASVKSFTCRMRRGRLHPGPCPERGAEERAAAPELDFSSVEWSAQPEGRLDYV